MKKYFWKLIALGFSLLFIEPITAQTKTVSDYNILWTTPGINSQGSMPIGNGDIGANVWVEGNGDLVFYVSKTDSWSEIGGLLKLGRVRISILPNPFNEKTFKQELKLQNGEIDISYGDTKIRFWIDANHPVIQADITSKTPVQVKVAYENWRKEKRPILGEEAKSVWGIGPNQVSKDCPTEIFQYPDTVLQYQKDMIVSLHHNNYSIFDEDLKTQALSGLTDMPDPLLHRNFGVRISGAGLSNVSDTMLVSAKARNNFQIQVFPLTMNGSIANWKRQILKQSSTVLALSLQSRLAAHIKWWRNFWNRSFIFISANDSIENAKANIVTRGYILQRYINACSGRGNSPIKFNGSIFTVDTYNRKSDYIGYDADFRLWGGCYWWQNTRFAYWSSLLSGDFDVMKPLFKMYMDALPLREAATKKYYHHDGAFFPETMNFWGTYADSDYGCNRDGLADGYTNNPYIRYYWQSGLELSLMMADYYSFTKRPSFAKDTLLPFVSAILTFYDQHWKRGNDGKILFDPAHSLETYHTAINPLPEIVGIKVVAEKMLQLPGQFTGNSRRMQWKKLLKDLPAVPTRIADEKTVLAPAQQYSNKANIENPELYAVFPYRLYGVGKPDLALAVNTFNGRIEKANGGWQQNAIQAACLGLTEAAKNMIVQNFSNRDSNFRFPAFWGPNYDWTPDQCHGNVSMLALQRMLLQYDNDKGIMMPSWPKEWNVKFKLAGPDMKIYQGEYKDGKLIKK